MGLMGQKLELRTLPFCFGRVFQRFIFCFLVRCFVYSLFVVVVAVALSLCCVQC